jgi:hypothetical protein
VCTSQLFYIYLFETLFEPNLHDGGFRCAVAMAVPVDICLPVKSDREDERGGARAITPPALSNARCTDGQRVIVPLRCEAGPFRAIHFRSQRGFSEAV